MTTSFKFLIFALLVCSVLTTCKKEPETVTGCTDPLGDTYNAAATVDDGSCTFQKRFLGDYAGEFKCKGQFAAVFSMAQLSITELIKKDEVNIIIASTIGPLPVMGKLTKNDLTVDALLPNLKIKVGDVIPGAGNTQVLVDGKVKTVLTISADNKILTGVIKLELVTKEAFVIGGILPVAAGTPIADECDFKGTKK
jgi:hypothetical protein